MQLVVSVNAIAEETASVQYSTKPRDKKIQIVTYNIQHGRHSSGAFDNIIELLAASEADIICLQEVDLYSNVRNTITAQSERIAKALDGYQWCAATGRRKHSGPVIMVRGRILEHEELAVAKHPPYAVAAKVEINGQRLIVVSVHLHSLSGTKLPTAILSTESQRVAEVRHLLSHLSRETLPVLIAGDFNALPIFPSYALLAAKYKDAAADRNVHSFTRKTSGFPARIDYVFASQHFKINAYEVLQVDYSDHRPIKAELTTIPKQPPPPPDKR